MMHECRSLCWCFYINHCCNYGSNISCIAGKKQFSSKTLHLPVYSLCSATSEFLLIIIHTADKDGNVFPDNMLTQKSEIITAMLSIKNEDFLIYSKHTHTILHIIRTKVTCDQLELICCQLQTWFITIHLLLVVSVLSTPSEAPLGKQSLRQCAFSRSMRSYELLSIHWEQLLAHINTV